ncbi:MAG: hypothetical protein IJD79_10425 [Clostridia bacterium]|nr:hypothetical protein [Clostridia bacterium]
MTDLFIRLFNISVSASFFVLAIILFRLIFKKAPKFISVLLFGLVGIRLILPFSIESSISLVPSKSTLPDGVELEKYPMIESGIPAVDEIVNPYFENSFAPMPEASANPLQIVFAILANIWLLVAALMLLYLVLSFTLLKLKLRESVAYNEGVRFSDRVKTPFILGIIKPKIYVPSDISESDLSIVIAHERAHIERGDHVWKPLAFVILSVYWFNPLFWLAYYFLCRDIELACDEKVMKNYNDEKKAEYSEALLKMSTEKSSLGACPLAFGEVGVKSRIRRIADYTKPAALLVALSVITTVILGACFLTDKKIEDEKITEGIYFAHGALYSSDMSEITTDDVPLFIFFTDGRIMVESQNLASSTFGEIGAVNKCFLSKKDYLELFDGADIGVDHVKKHNKAVYRTAPPKEITDIDCDELYFFVQDTGEVLLGYAYRVKDGAKIDKLFSLKMNETLPTNYMIASYREVSDATVNDREYGWIKEFSINPTNNTMSINFGLLSSYIAFGNYEIIGNRLIFTSSDSYSEKYVFDISKKNPTFVAKESTTKRIKDGTEFKRYYEIYNVPASIFYDVGGDGRYELVHLSKSETGGEFKLNFSVFARGEKFPTFSVLFKKYDYVTLSVNKNTSDLILSCYNKDLITKKDRYSVVFAGESVVITPIE